MRTGLTCATLTLITFVMICFTSVRNDIVEENNPVGKAPYQGMLIRKEKFSPITDAEVFAFESKYQGTYPVCKRKMLIGRQDPISLKSKNPDLTALYDAGNGRISGGQLQSVMMLNHDEPLKDRITFLTKPNWFTAAQDRDNSSMCPVMIPDKLADNLGISVSGVDSGNVIISISGRTLKVQGIFSSESLNKLRDLDGRDILPFDIEKLTNIASAQHNTEVGIQVVDDNAERIAPDKIVITPHRKLFDESTAQSRILLNSVVISMPGASYKEAKNSIVSFMEQTGEPVYFGLDGVSYKGRISRSMTMAGLIDLLIPLLIAGLTVLNTMRGSVYERRQEIYVYNAVGIAPRYVFFMFIAEAFVYVVVGSVLGYILSQGTGRILTMLNLTGGLNMTFTSISTIYASLTIAAAVFVSTYFPARSAMEIATPAEDAGWALPEPISDELRFDLPFNFDSRDRIAVLEFFNRFLLDNGEGGAGRFFAGRPVMNIVAIETGSDDEQYLPQICSTIWLKPFDLAVSQEMAILMPRDPDTGQFKAHICLQRVSGSRESWMRLNKGFVKLIRKHFLHWRAVPDQDRKEMFVEAKERILRPLNPPQGELKGI
jgi:ABC-type lipoprotein release transport system permease subunit